MKCVGLYLILLPWAEADTASSLLPETFLGKQLKPLPPCFAGQVLTTPA